MRNYGHRVAIHPMDDNIIRSAKPGGVLGYRIEHRLDVSRGAADHPQYLGGYRLLFERLFRFVEQPDIFDGDNCLVREGPEKFLVLPPHTVDLCPTDNDRADCNTFAQHRNGKYLAPTDAFCKGASKV